jgi:hypothetical protein
MMQSNGSYLGGDPLLGSALDRQLKHINGDAARRWRIGPERVLFMSSPGRFAPAETGWLATAIEDKNPEQNQACGEATIRHPAVGGAPELFQRERQAVPFCNPFYGSGAPEHLMARMGHLLLQARGYTPACMGLCNR